MHLRACEARELRARKSLTPRFTDFFTDFEKKTDCFAVYLYVVSLTTVWMLDEGLQMIQEVIIDFLSAFVTLGKITETKSSRKESSFPAEVPLKN